MVAGAFTAFLKRAREARRATLLGRIRVAADSGAPGRFRRRFSRPRSPSSLSPVPVAPAELSIFWIRRCGRSARPLAAAPHISSRARRWNSSVGVVEP